MAHDLAAPPTPIRPLNLFMTADAVGGVFTYALDLARGLTRHGVTTTLAMLGPSPTPGQRARAAGIPGLRLVETHLPLDWLAEDRRAADQAASEVAALAAFYRADIVHLNTPALACDAYACPVLVVLHSCLASWWSAVKQGPMPPDFRWRTELMAHGLRCADASVCPSAALAAEVGRLYGRTPRVVHNGRWMPPEPPAAPGLAPYVFSTGRFWDEGKGLSTLAAAAPLIDLPVRVAGPVSGPKGGAASTDALTTLGMLDEADMRARLAEAPIFVSTALYEPFGLGVLEAAQAGCALVLSDLASFRELWSGAAQFVPPREPAAFAAAINTLAGDAPLRTRLGAAARERAGRYTVEAMAARMRGIYAGLVAGRKGAAA